MTELSEDVVQAIREEIRIGFISVPATASPNPPLPYDLRTELAVLALLVEGSIPKEHRDKMATTDFFFPLHATALPVIREALDAGKGPEDVELAIQSGLPTFSKVAVLSLLERIRGAPVELPVLPAMGRLRALWRRRQALILLARAEACLADPQEPLQSALIQIRATLSALGA